MIVVVSGVSGVGKTTVGMRLAPAIGARFVDADDLQPKANVEKMARGEGLDDADRAPWLSSLRAAIDEWLARDQDVVLACSALKESYRRQLAHDDPRVRFVMLDAPAEAIARRLASRKGHFAGPELLASQLATLEKPADALIVDATQPLDDVVARITSWVRDKRSSRS
ncbi:MAG: gluconokinase [Polyangiales bacterium]